MGVSVVSDYNKGLPSFKGSALRRPGPGLLIKALWYNVELDNYRVFAIEWVSTVYRKLGCFSFRMPMAVLPCGSG
jgi:hypothetical protein